MSYNSIYWTIQIKNRIIIAFVCAAISAKSLCYPVYIIAFRFWYTLFFINNGRSLFGLCYSFHVRHSQKFILQYQNLRIRNLRQYIIYVNLYQGHNTFANIFGFVYTSNRLAGTLLYCIHLKVCFVHILVTKQIMNQWPILFHYILEWNCILICCLRYFLFGNLELIEQVCRREDKTWNCVIADWCHH